MLYTYLVGVAVRRIRIIDLLVLLYSLNKACLQNVHVKD